MIWFNKKLISLLIVFLLFSTPVFAETIQMMVAGLSTTAINTAAAQYYNFQSSGGGSTTEANRRAVAASAGTVLRMKAYLTTAPDNGAGTDTVTFAVRIAGGTSSTSCTISESETSCESNTTSTYSAGNAFALIETPANTPAASNFMVWIWTVDNTDKTTIYLGGSEGTTLATGATNYHAMINGNTATTTENLVQIPMPFAGNITTLYVLLDGSPNNGAGTQSYQFTIYKNGSGVSTNTCTISETATTCNDTTTSLAFNAGDTISMETIPASTPTARRAAWGIAVTNTVDGFAMFGGQNASFADATNTYYHPFGPFSYSTTETDRQQKSSQINFFGLYVAMHTDPDNGGGTQSYAITLMDDTNALNNTCTISDGQTSCSSSLIDSVLVDSLIDFRAVPANTPVATGVWIGAWAFINPRTFFMVS